MPDKSRDYQDQPTYWFVIMEIARERDDEEQVAQAQRELARLGVYVEYRRPVRFYSAGGITGVVADDVPRIDPGTMVYMDGKGMVRPLPRIRRG